jgi:hypothetical protein
MHDPNRDLKEMLREKLGYIIFDYKSIQVLDVHFESPLTVFITITHDNACHDMVISIKERELLNQFIECLKEHYHGLPSSRR